jgi:hypothetical protein
MRISFERITNQFYEEIKFIKKFNLMFPAKTVKDKVKEMGLYNGRGSYSKLAIQKAVLELLR